MEILQGRPDICFGVHLTLVRDTSDCYWRPVSAPQDISSLLDSGGAMYTSAAAAQLLARVRLAEVVREFRAQLETVLKAGLTPTHLDFHCLADGGREDVLDLAVALATEHGLAVRVWLEPARRRLRAGGRPVIDHDFLDSFSLQLPGKAARYADLLRHLSPGLSEWVHPGLADDQARTVDLGWDVRCSDLDFLLSRDARDLLRHERITVIDYRPLQQAWAAAG